MGGCQVDSVYNTIEQGQCFVVDLLVKKWYLWVHVKGQGLAIRCTVQGNGSIYGSRIETFAVDFRRCDHGA